MQHSMSQEWSVASRQSSRSVLSEHSSWSLASGVCVCTSMCLSLCLSRCLCLCLCLCQSAVCVSLTPPPSSPHSLATPVKPSHSRTRSLSMGSHGMERGTSKGKTWTTRLSAACFHLLPAPCPAKLPHPARSGTCTLPHTTPVPSQADRGSLCLPLRPVIPLRACRR